MSSRDKLRSLFFATLMITSVFAGTVVISGSAAANASGVTISGYAGNTPDTVGDPVGVNVTVANGDTVTVENIVDGDVVNTITVTDGGSGDEDGAENGNIDVTIQAAKQAGGGASTVKVTGPNGNTVSDTYTTETYDVQVTDTVTHGATETIQGKIYEYPGRLEDDKVRYSLQFDPDLSNAGSTNQILSDSNTSNGQFQTTKTFNIVDTGAFLNDYPQDGADLSTAQPAYAVYVSSTDLTTTPGDDPGHTDNDGADIIDTRLDVSGSPNQNPVYNRTFSFINGNVANATTPLNDYQVVFKDPNDVTAQSVTTANNGDFSFTVVPNDAGTWALGTNEGAFINYSAVDVEGQTGTLDLQQSSAARKNFDTDYFIDVRDASGKSIDTSAGNIDGYINVTGNFTNLNTPEGSVVREKDTDGDGFNDFAHVETNATGEVTLNLATQQNVLNAELEVESAFSTGPFSSQDGAEVEDDAADTANSPDYFGSDSVNVGVAEPVNILNLQVEDPVDSDFTSAGGPEADAGGAPATQVGSDSAPRALEPLPLATGDAPRRVSGLRLGSDTFRGFDQITTYRVTFDLVDQQSDTIEPNEIDNPNAPKLNNLTFVGAGINTTVNVTVDIPLRPAGTPSAFFDRNGGQTNVLQVEHLGGGSYEAIVRPVSVDEAGETFDVVVDVAGQPEVSTGGQNQPNSLNTSGLYVPRFQVNGQTVDEVAGNQTIDVAAQVKNPETSPNVVNNGRVNLSQEQNTDPNTIANIQLGSVDGRVASIGNGSYEFENVDLGPRGLDTDSDGIAEDVAQLTFTAYQYKDADNSQSLDQDEVNNATVETLPLATNNNIDATFINATIENGVERYAGNSSTGNFTLTAGVEYEDLTLRLVRDDGTPVNLTDGLFGQKVALDDLESATLPDGSAPYVYINILGAPHRVEFDEAESAPGQGIYQVDDIQDVGLVSTNGGGLTDGTEADNFVFDSPTPDSRLSPQFVATTPGATNSTGMDDLFIVDQPTIITNITGVAGQAVPNSSATAPLGASNFNNNTAGITTPTIGVDRTYLVNATVRDALNNTALNASDFSEVGVFVANEDAEDATFGQEAVVDIPNGAPGYAEGADTGAGEGAVVQNQDGEFQFVINVTDDGADNNGQFTPYFFAEAQASTVIDDTPPGGAAPDGTALFSGTPVAQNPVVEVYDENGAELPLNPSAGSSNPVLAQDVRNNLRVETFQADQDDFTLPNGIRLGLVGPYAETDVEGTTTLSQSVVTEGYSEGQIVFLSVTPRGTGDGLLSLRGDNAAPAGSVTTADAVTRNVTGEPIRFDVLRSNLNVNITVQSATPATAGGNITTLIEQQNTGEQLESVRVELVDPSGTVVNSALTNSTGQATLTVPSTAADGTFTIQTRPAGFAPASEDVQVAGATELTIVDNSLSAPSSAQVGTNISVSAVVENTGGVSTTQTVEFRFDLNNDGVLAGGEVVASKSVEVAASTTKTVTFSQLELPSTAGTFDHGVFTLGDSATATINITQDNRPAPVDDPATDVDGDSQLEDVNGDNALDILDVVALFDNLNSNAVQNNVGAFDFNNDGQINILDVVALNAER